MEKRTAVVVGASHAAAQLCASLRQEGWEGEVIMIGDEPFLPYHRPPLSKYFLTGALSVDDLLIRSPEFYRKNNIEFRRGIVNEIDRTNKKICLSDGDSICYDKLALCLGARVREIKIPGANLPGVCYLRSIADVNNIKMKLEKAKRAIIIGGGYIGLETAAAFRKLGVQVVILEVAERLLQRVASPDLSEFYARIHAEEGVDVRTGVEIVEIVGSSHVEGVRCAGNLLFPADLVVVGIGVLPNVELAQQAGLVVDSGIVVDEYCRTNDHDIVAAGDCAALFDNESNRHVRMESIFNANEQGKIAAGTLCGVEKKAAGVPWFWSDQYDIKLQIAGINHGYDQFVIRGDKNNDRNFSIFYLRDGVVVSVDCVNRPKEFLFGKKLILNKVPVDLDLLRNDSVPLNDLIGVGA